MKDNFSSNSFDYVKYRPHYPQELFDFILAHVQQRNLAWDCGTGNGQSAAVLADYFKNIYATDLSGNQLAHAVQKPNIDYRCEVAEKSSLANDSVDLVTVSQALHWFDLPAFYPEVKRVSKSHGVFAAWTYNLLQCDPHTDALILHFYNNTLNGYWDPERALVDDGYRTILFPFEEIPAPVFSMQVRWTAEALGGYLSTWSAVKKFVAVNGFDPVGELMVAIGKLWRYNDERDINFPIYLKAGRVH